MNAATTSPTSSEPHSPIKSNNGEEMTISDRIKAFLGHDPKASHSASYEELSPTTSRCTFVTPARGARERVVNLSVDEIEDLILAASDAKKARK